jgi:myo-inositol-1(or 4)-monophosphatase
MMSEMYKDKQPSVSELRQVCEAAARAGGRELLAWRGRFKTREKSPADLVTDADLASQAAVRAVIAAHYPNHLFMGEEQQPDAQTFDGKQYLWLVDPLDGTTNYVHGYPCYAVSVAVAGKIFSDASSGRELLAGVVLDPIAEECFSAARGEGARLNGSRLRTSAATTVADALVAVSLPPRVAHDAPDLADFVRVVQVSQAVRRSGSAALNLAYVAAGRLDAFWATHIHAWDVAAGVLLVREAGGLVTGRDGNEFDLRKPHFISAANADLHRDLLRVLSDAKM